MVKLSDMSKWRNGWDDAYSGKRWPASWLIKIKAILGFQ